MFDKLDRSRGERKNQVTIQRNHENPYDSVGSFLLEEEHSKEGHEDHHAVGEQRAGGFSVDSSESGGVSKVNAHFVTLSLLLVGVISGGQLLHGVLGDTVILHLVVVLVHVGNSLLVVLHHHADLEH